MKRFTFAALAVMTLLVPILAFAQASLPADLPTDQALEIFVKSLGGLKGASALAIALVVVQAVMLFFRTPLANFALNRQLVFR
jgi:type IV secretory pathway VirB2 component (pilin)